MGLCSMPICLRALGRPKKPRTQKVLSNLGMAYLSSPVTLGVSRMAWAGPKSQCLFMATHCFLEQAGLRPGG